MKIIIASLLALFGASSLMTADREAQIMDPNSILFTVPTISNDLAPLEPVRGGPANPTSRFMKTNGAKWSSSLTGSSRWCSEC